MPQTDDTHPPPPTLHHHARPTLAAAPATTPAASRGDHGAAGDVEVGIDLGLPLRACWGDTVRAPTHVPVLGVADGRERGRAWPPPTAVVGRPPRGVAALAATAVTPGLGRRSCSGGSAHRCCPTTSRPGPRCWPHSPARTTGGCSSAR